MGFTDKRIMGLKFNYYRIFALKFNSECLGSILPNSGTTDASD